MCIQVLVGAPDPPKTLWILYTAAPIHQKRLYTRGLRMLSRSQSVFNFFVCTLPCAVKELLASSRSLPGDVRTCRRPCQPWSRTGRNFAISVFAYVLFLFFVLYHGRINNYITNSKTVRKCNCISIFFSKKKNGAKM